MSDLLNQASLVMVPSGYKEDTVYSVVPSDGSGDLSFTRASNGTRVNSAGLVEVCPWNMLQYSEDFSNAYWNKYQASITSNTTTAPNGTATADTLVSGSGFAGVVYTSAIFSAGDILTLSIYAKANTSSILQLGTTDGTDRSANFNLSTGVVVSSVGVTASIESVGNGWYRCSVSRTMLNPANFFVVEGTGSLSLFIWGAQTNVGVSAKPYFPTTDRLNVPRLTYQNGGGGCPSLLLEKQSTNVAYYSNDLATAPNVVDASTTTANVYVSPDGTQNAMRFTETTAVDRHGFYQYTTVTAQTYTASIFTKQTGRRYISFVSDMKGVSDAAYFDLQTKTAINVASGYTCSVEDFGNGWLRLIVTFTATAGTRYVIWGGSPDGSSTFYGGSTSISQTFYGYQLEAGSYATSYIPTTSATATRVADACFKTGISSLIGGGVGTWFMDFEFIEDTISNYTFAFNLSDGTITNHLYLYYNNPSWYWGGVDTAITLPATLRKKVAVKFSSGTGKLFCNGSLISTLSLSTAFSRLDIGQRFSNTFPMDGKINQAYFLTTSLTDAECQAITTI